MTEMPRSGRLILLRWMAAGSLGTALAIAIIVVLPCRYVGRYRMPFLARDSDFEVSLQCASRMAASSDDFAVDVSVRRTPGVAVDWEAAHIQRTKARLLKYSVSEEIDDERGGLVRTWKYTFRPASPGKDKADQAYFGPFSVDLLLADGSRQRTSSNSCDVLIYD